MVINNVSQFWFKVQIVTNVMCIMESETNIMMVYWRSWLCAVTLTLMFLFRVYMQSDEEEQVADENAPLIWSNHHDTVVRSRSPDRA